jgi:hypothetical protein
VKNRVEMAEELSPAARRLQFSQPIGEMAMKLGLVFC